MRNQVNSLISFIPDRILIKLAILSQSAKFIATNIEPLSNCIAKTTFPHTPWYHNEWIRDHCRYFY